ncbi:MAG: hypothetical protein EAZ60_13455 [Oscillatoriales cyanobacterium]|nr:MAG: hypothetical protein EAZ60_13455 [Oscillatoriales cyanobacterium]
MCDRLIDRTELNVIINQEPEVLSSCSDLIDAGFVQMLIQISASMAREGDEDTANFLVQLARLLGKSLGLSPDVVPASYSSPQR